VASIDPGRVWSEEIRLALQSSEAALIILTPNSLKSAWVMAEAGALWVLDIPFVPALMFVERRLLPELISRRQDRDITTSASRVTCAEAVVALLRPLHRK